jgi:hypothetical protein
LQLWGTFKEGSVGEDTDVIHSAHLASAPNIEAASNPLKRLAIARLLKINHAVLGSSLR